MAKSNFGFQRELMLDAISPCPASVPRQKTSDIRRRSGSTPATDRRFSLRRSIMSRTWTGLGKGSVFTQFLKCGGGIVVVHRFILPPRACCVSHDAGIGTPFMIVSSHRFAPNQ